MSVKAPTSDEVFNEWLSKADFKTLEKAFKRKKVDFKREHVSAVETVQTVTKFIVVYFEKNVADSVKAAAPAVTETVPPSKISGITFFNFGNKKVNIETWKHDHSVPMYPSLKEEKCKACGGEGRITCKTCKGGRLVPCKKCEGKGTVNCRACNGSKTDTVKIQVIDASGKSEKVARKVPCPECSGKGGYTCPECAGTGKKGCKDCNGRGTLPCKDCKGHGIVFKYEIAPVPFIVAKKSANVYYSKKVEKFIDKKTVESLLNARDIQGIVVTDPKDLEEKKLKPQLNYWTKDADALLKNARNDYKNLEKKGVVKKGTRIMVFPALQLDCVSVRKKKFQIFGIGTSNSFVVLDHDFS